MAAEIKLEIVYLLSGKEADRMMKNIQFDNLQETLYNEKLDNGLDVYILPNVDFRKHS